MKKQIIFLIGTVILSSGFTAFSQTQYNATGYYSFSTDYGSFNFTAAYVVPTTPYMFGYVIEYPDLQISTTKSFFSFNKSIKAIAGTTNVELGVNGSPKLIIKSSNGYVGVGTTNPTYRLTVNGGILCEEVKVIGNVPDADYVFEEDYPLAPLSEVESFIKENKHLPNIPSAQEFKTNGYKVGDMDEMLLRKVEELTLYIIQLEKQVKELQEANKKGGE